MRTLAVGRYRHFKGNEYEVLGSALHTESGEELVIYRPLYGSFRLCARPLTMFTAMVETNGQMQPRFRYVGPEKVTRLSHTAQAQARTFLLTRARPLEAARYRHHFEQGAVDDIYAGLSAFQNDDGGYGHGLEPDLQTSASSVLATTVALQILAEIGAAASQPQVAGAIHFLLNTYDPALNGWPIIPPAAENAAHAPWWAAAGLAERFGHFRCNPTAEVIAYLHDYQQLVDAGWLAEITRATLSHILAQPDDMGMNELHCCLRLLESTSLPAAIRQPLHARLSTVVAHTMARDPADWAHYTLQPLAVAPAPGAVFASQLAELLAQNLDYRIDTQGADGAWTPTWSWGALDATGWAQAEPAWQGVLTLDALRTLDAYGRLAI